MKGELWAWHDFESDMYTLIYNCKLLVEMCSPDGFKRSTELGKGKIVKLKVVEVEDGK